MSFIINSYAFGAPSVFETSWKTDNSGVSTSTQIQLPLENGGTYNFDVDWGDGNTDTITTWNQAETLHTYGSAGTYTVKINGQCEGWRFANGGDRLKILTIESFGPNFKWGNSGNYFDGCENLSMTNCLDAPDMTGCTSMYRAFTSCVNLQTCPGLANLDVSAVLLFELCFYNCYRLDLDFSTWDISFADNIEYLFTNCCFFSGSLTGIENFIFRSAGVPRSRSLLYSVPPAAIPDITGWDTSTIESMKEWFGRNGIGTGFNQDITGWDVSNCIDFSDMFIGNASFNQPIGSWTLKPAASIFCYGMFRFATSFNQSLNGWTNTSSISGNVGEMFRGATSYNQDMDLWDTSNFTQMLYMFDGCTVFNGDITTWDVSGVTTFERLFNGCNALNQDLSGWTTTSLTRMDQTFRNCHSMTYSINGWDTSSVTLMDYCFSCDNAAPGGYNANLDLLDTSACTSFNSCFRYNPDFNGDVTTWDVSAVTGEGLNFMFDGCFTFNQDIGSWSFPNATQLAGTLSNCDVFDQDLSAWDVSNITTMSQLFQNCTSLSTANISGWDVSSVDSFFKMFLQCYVFDDDISGWDVSSGVNFEGFLQDATAFDRNLGSWEMSNATNLINFMHLKDDADFTPANLDAIYNGWTDYELQTGRTANFGTCKYTAAGQEGRDLLTRANATVNVSDATDNGSGLIRIETATNHGRATGDKVFIKNVGGVTAANGPWTVTNISATEIDLQGSTFSGTYTSGGTVRTGYGWTVTDDGI